MADSQPNASSDSPPNAAEVSPPPSPSLNNTSNSNNTPRGGTKEGFLEKKGAVNKNWRERWFYLNNGLLEYFVDKDKQKKKGAISMADVSEIGPLTHGTRSFCFGLNSGKRLWVLSADTSETRDSWMAILRAYVPKSLEAGTKVPTTAIGSLKKSLLKKMNKGDEEKGSPSNPNTSNTSSTAPTTNGSFGAASSQTASSSAAPAPGSAIIASSNSSSPGSTISPRSTDVPFNNGASPVLSSASSSTSPIVASPMSTHLDSSKSSPMSSPSLSAGRTTQIVSNEPRATMVVPSSFANWNPKLAWDPTPERPAWCYEMAPGLPPDLSAWLSPMLSGATRFNMGWAFVLDWVRRIGNSNYTNAVILENIKQGMTKLQPCWAEFDRALAAAEIWDISHTAVSKFRNQVAELHTLADTKVSGWHVQLSSKVSQETEFELTYKRQDSGTPERPAWFFRPTDASTQVSDAFIILERAATVFNSGWAQAYEASKSISSTNKAAAGPVKDIIVKALMIVESCFKDFEAALAGFEAWNALSLYTLEVKQQIGTLKRMYETNKRDWLAHLDARASFVLVNKTDYLFEHPPATPERPAWCFKFSLNTPSDISRGLVALSGAANIFNSNWAVAFEWANKIGRNMATRAAIKDGMMDAITKLEASWPEFESAIRLLENWEIAATEVIRQVSQLRGLIEESKESWLAKLATDSEISLPSVGLGSDFRLSGFGPEVTAFSTESAVGSDKVIASMMSTVVPDDARLMYENTLAASREAASISDHPEVKLNFVPGLGPGSFGNADIYRTVLKELYRAQLLPNTQPEILADIRTLIVETQQRHRDLCFKWALHYAREGIMNRSIEYYEALFEVLPDAVTELDLQLAQLKAEFEASPENQTQSMSFATL